MVFGVCLVLRFFCMGEELSFLGVGFFSVGLDGCRLEFGFLIFGGGFFLLYYVV